jgi:uncharacterized protein (DUF2235 family)
MKRIVICCDGTWQSPFATFLGRPAATNVVRLKACVAARDAEGTSQVVYYDQGVGTGNLLDRLSGGLTGHGLDQNIIEAYRFLIQNYEAGDELFLFGFSRGAYTVRSLAGMIRKCGIVRRENTGLEAEAMRLYRDPVRADAQGPEDFRRAFSIAQDVPIKLIGVWDTVGALGLPLTLSKRYAFHDTELSATVERAYQALALDERRRAFPPTLWELPEGSVQTLEQVWFSGSHSDVGGGSGSSGLPDLSLAWMFEKAEQAGLAFDDDARRADPLQPRPNAKLNFVERGGYWYFLFGVRDRAVGLKTPQPGQPAELEDPTQQIADAVRTRWRQLSDYRPRNLNRYFLRTRDALGELALQPELRLKALLG